VDMLGYIRVDMLGWICWVIFVRTCCDWVIFKWIRRVIFVWI
jgi:hypothetical protein